MTKPVNEEIALALKVENWGFNVLTDAERDHVQKIAVAALRSAPAQCAHISDEQVETAWAAIVGSDIADICFNASIVRADLRTALETLVAAPPAGGEPAAWVVERERDPTFPRFYQSKAEADAMVDYVTASPRAVAKPLYATPQAQEPACREALLWAMDEIDVLSNKLSGFAYPQGMGPADRASEQDNYVKAVMARRAALASSSAPSGQMNESKLAREIEAAWDIEPTPFNRADVAVRVVLASSRSPAPAAGMDDALAAIAAGEYTELPPLGDSRRSPGETEGKR